MNPALSVLLCCLVAQIALNVEAQTTTLNAKYDVDELRCLVCQASIEELEKVVSKIDPTRKIDVGGYQLDKDGNINRKTVSEAKSEIHLSELIETICDKFDEYVRGIGKTDGKLSLMKLIQDNGQMNPLLSTVDLIQDDDLNKSLKYYCESIMEEFEDHVIKHIQMESQDIKTRVCLEDTGLCKNYVKDSSKNTLLNEEL